MEAMLTSLVRGGPIGGEAAVFEHLTFNTLKGHLLSPDSANASRADRGKAASSPLLSFPFKETLTGGGRGIIYLKNVHNLSNDKLLLEFQS